MATTELGGRVDLDGPRMQEPDGWTHHVLDLDGNAEIRTAVLDSPPGKTDRARAVKAVVGNRTTLTADSAVSAGARQLSARQTYQASPLSYLDAAGRSWSVWAENDRLEWAEFGAADARPAELYLWFRDVAVGGIALVSLEVSAGATGPGVTGFYEIRSSDAPPRLIPVTGFRDETVDVVVRPDDPFAVLVTVRPGAGLGYFALRNACYLPL